MRRGYILISQLECNQCIAVKLSTDIEEETRSTNGPGNTLLSKEIYKVKNISSYDEDYPSAALENGGPK